MFSNQLFDALHPNINRLFGDLFLWTFSSLKHWSQVTNYILVVSWNYLNQKLRFLITEFKTKSQRGFYFTVLKISFQVFFQFCFQKQFMDLVEDFFSTEFVFIKNGHESSNIFVESEMDISLRKAIYTSLTKVWIHFT